MEKINYNGLSRLATPVGAAMLADILHSSVAYTSVCAYMYGLVRSAIELRVFLLRFLHIQIFYKGVEKAESDQMPILGAFAKKRGNYGSHPKSLVEYLTPQR